MFGWIANWVKKKAIEWIAGQIGLRPEYLEGVIDEIFAFLKEIFGAFGGAGDAVAFMKEYTVKSKAQSANVKRVALKKALETL